MSNTVEDKDTTLETGDKSQPLRSHSLHDRDRLRGQEITYLEELAELISASVTDMSSFSVKPEKCAILQESLQQIKQLKQENEQHSTSSEAVQQSQVSSSKPARLANDVLGPLLLEALDGFLFVVNSQGKIDFVSENITQYLKYTQDDLIGKSVYNIIHVGDHAQFSSSLMPVSLSSVIQWPSDSTVIKGRTFNCRMLIKPPCEDVDDVEVKQTCISQYENMHISSVSQSGDKITGNSDNSEGQSCLVCIARRLSFSEETNTMLGIEQFTTKQDINGKIIANDTSKIIPRHYPCPEFNGQNIQEFCHVNDVQTLNKHYQEVLNSGCNTSSVYRFKLQENLYVFVQTRSKRFSNGNNGDPDFIMSTHSIIRECDSDLELKGSASTSLMKSIIGQSNLVGGQRPPSGLPTSVSPMAILNALSQPFMLGNSNVGLMTSRDNEIADNMDLSQANWDSLLGDFGIGSSNANNSNSISVVNNNNGNLSMSGGTVTSSAGLWNNIPQRMKSPSSNQQQQQQLIRNMMNMQQTNNSNIPTNFSRSNSFDGGQKSPSYPPSPGLRGSASQKSPGYPQSPGLRGSSFQMPSSQQAMRGVGYSGQRSPGSASVTQNRMSPANAAYSSQRTPTSSGNQPNNWNRLHQAQREFSIPSSSGSSDPLSNLQNIGAISPSPRLSEFTFPSVGGSVEKRSKLSQLLSGNSSSGSDIFRTPSVESLECKDRLNDNMVIKSPADSMHQSPTPGPGQSPPEKPMSTTHLEEDVGKSKPLKEENKNVILKQLLSTDEDNEAAPSEINTEEINTDMNEAEAKKPPNHLLKQLLGTDSKRVNKEKSKGVADKGQKSELLPLLLEEDEGAGCTSAPAESTSQESDSLSRSRNPSGQQEPQSSTHPTSTSLTQSTFNLSSPSPDTKMSFDLEVAKKLTSNVSKSQMSANLGDKHLDSLLHSLWEKGNDMPSNLPNLSRKRKASGSDVDSTEKVEMDLLSGSQQLQKPASKFREKNVLLAKLLSKQTPTEPVVNTRYTVNPCDMPQNKLPNNLQEKFLRLQPLDIQKANEKSEEKELAKREGLQSLSMSNSNMNVSDSSLDSFGNMSNTGLNQNMNLDRSMNINNGMNSGGGFLQQNTSLGNSNSVYQMDGNSIHNILGQGNNLDSGNDLDQASNDQALLAKILEQAAELQQDITTGNVTPAATAASTMNTSVGSNQGPGIGLNQIQGLGSNQNPGLGTNQGQGIGSNQSSVSDDAQWLSQLEQVISDSNFQINDIESLINTGMGSQTGQPMVEDHAAIEAIQKQLMSEEPLNNTSGMMDTSGLRPGQNRIAGPVRQNSFPPLASPSMGQMSGGIDVSMTQMSPHAQQPAPSPQGFNQTVFNAQRPRHPNPTPPGSLASALQTRQQQRPMFPTSSAIQVRQSLIQQQKMKQLREIEKQRVERQKQLMQRQLSQQFNQRFPQNMDTSQVPAFPENLAEMMNTGNAPNVTLQRNQIPGPMSPRFGPGLQQQQHPNLSQLIGPNSAPPASPISPHFNQQAQNQCYIRSSQGMQSPMGIPPKSNQYAINRHRSLSGGTVPNNSQVNQFQFSDQFSGGSSGQINMYNQQQSMYQNRMMRQMSLPPGQLPGRGSPRTPVSPYGNSPDPLLMSPHSSISPNSSMRNPQASQISPPFQGNLPSNTNFGQGSNVLGNPTTQTSVANPAFQDFDMQLAEIDKMGIGTNTTSQYVKQELRNICSARSDQKQHQNQQSMSQSMPPSLSQSKPQSISQQLQSQQSISQTRPSLMSQSMVQSVSQPIQKTSTQFSAAHSLPQQLIEQPDPPMQTQSSFDFDGTSEIPSDIIEDIHEMEKEHQVHAAFDINNFKEEDILKVKRQEAKHIYEQFRALANREKEICSTPIMENPEIKATTLFRNQLTTQQKAAAALSNATPHLIERLKAGEKQVQVVAKEPRNMVEEIRPPDHKNSLLQQLLSD